MLKFGEFIAFMNLNFNMGSIFLVLNTLDIPYVFSSDDDEIQLTTD